MSVSRCILIVEDEPLISMMLEDFVQSLGHSVAAICESVEDALKAIDGDPFDLAILDVNLNGRRSYPIARALSDRGVPFAFATGYGGHGVGNGYGNGSVLSKPFDLQQLVKVLTILLERA